MSTTHNCVEFGCTVNGLLTNEMSGDYGGKKVESRHGSPVVIKFSLCVSAIKMAF